MPDKLRIDQPRQIQALEGLGLGSDLDAAEAASWRRYVPGGGRVPWREVAAFEKEIGRLEERRREVEAKRLDLGDRLQSAPAHDLENLAAWERAGRRGPRPESTRPALEAEVARLQEGERALLHAVDAVTADRARFVEKNRDKLVREAGKIRETARERTERALGELEEARGELVRARALELWSLLYPSAEAGREPNFASLAGGLRRVGEMAGIQQAVAVEQVIAALREDVDWVASAVTREQQAKLGSATAGEWHRDARTGEWVWIDRERDRALEDAIRLHAQGRSDERRGELDRMRTKL